MAKRKIYIFFTGEILSIGGAQMYTAGKAKYLENLGWEVHVCFWGPNQGTSAIPSLNKYISNGGVNFLLTPPYKMHRYEQEQLLNLLTRKFNVPTSGECELITESHWDAAAYWAELFAAKHGGRHFFITTNETYRTSLLDPVKTYEDNLDFFYFKWKRNEMICSEKSCQALFNGYKNITAPLYEMPDTAREQDAIQDVLNFPIEKIARLDWNICHIGRMAKAYVPFVISGVAELARRHPNKKINFIFVGNAASRMDLINKTFNDITNVQLTFCNDLVPIPRNLITKVDVVCAISQTARFTANEGILTIVGSVTPNDRTPGVLGYDTEQQVRGEGTYSYVEALENVLVKRLYDGKKYSLPKLRPADEYYENFWTIVKKADPKKEYYVERLSRERIRNWTAIFPFGMIARGAKIILFGATDIAKDYKWQLLTQGNSQTEIGNDYIKHINNRGGLLSYCQVLATVDEHPEEFDNEVAGVERLKVKDYDAIVIATFPQQAQAAYRKILEVAPDMADRIVYNFQTNRT